MNAVAVFCGGSSGRGEVYSGAAREVGRALAEHGLTLVYGGGHIGLMGALAGKTAFLPRPGYAAVSRWFLAAALAGLLVADLQVTTLHPVARMVGNPDHQVEVSSGR